MEEKKERIKTWMAACMIIVALCIDLAQAILTAVGIGLILGPIMSVVSYFTYWIWFLMLKVSFTKSPKKLATTGISALIEVFLSFLPAFTLGVATVIIMTKAEDKGGLIGKAVGMAQGKMPNTQQSNVRQFNYVKQRGTPNKSKETFTDFEEEQEEKIAA